MMTLLRYFLPAVSLRFLIRDMSSACTTRRHNTVARRWPRTSSIWGMRSIWHALLRSQCVDVCLRGALVRVTLGAEAEVIRDPRLPWSSTWRPPKTWCTQKLSGRRYAGILKTHALHHLGVQRWMCCLSIPTGGLWQNLMPQISSLGRDIVAARDQTRHMPMWRACIRATAATLAVAYRVNRTLLGWDRLRSGGGRRRSTAGRTRGAPGAPDGVQGGTRPARSQQECERASGPLAPVFRPPEHVAAQTAHTRRGAAAQRASRSSIDGSATNATTSAPVLSARRAEWIDGGHLLATTLPSCPQCRLFAADAATQIPRWQRTHDERPCANKERH